MASGHDQGLTVPATGSDFPEWRQGRTHAFAWVIELDLPDVREILRLGRERLTHLLLPRYERAPHVTVNFCGLAPGAVPLPDDWTGRDLEQELAVLRGLINGPVTMQASSWGSFPMVPYLGVEAEWLRTAHDALIGLARHGHDMDYQPHLTLGHYRGEWPLSEPVAMLRTLPTVGTWLAEELSLVSFEAHDVAGPLVTLGRLDLTNGRWRPSPGTPGRGTASG